MKKATETIKVENRNLKVYKNEVINKIKKNILCKKNNKIFITSETLIYFEKIVHFLT